MLHRELGGRFTSVAEKLVGVVKTAIVRWGFGAANGILCDNQRQSSVLQYNGGACAVLALLVELVTAARTQKVCLRCGAKVTGHVRRGHERGCAIPGADAFLQSRDNASAMRITPGLHNSGNLSHQRIKSP